VWRHTTSKMWDVAYMYAFSRRPYCSAYKAQEVLKNCESDLSLCDILVV
jgi:hypothetical protein